MERPENRDRLYLLAGILVLLLVMACWWLPKLAPNESVYLLLPRQLAIPGFLPHPPATDPWQSLQLLFGLLMAPLAWLLHDPIQLAMAGRLLVWLPTVAGLVALTRQLQIAPWWSLLGIAVWSVSFQSVAAGEWVFAGVEQKVCAYALGFWALTMLLRGRLLAAGALSGLAVAFHVLVGATCSPGSDWLRCSPCPARESAGWRVSASWRCSSAARSWSGPCSSLARQLPPRLWLRSIRPRCP